MSLHRNSSQTFFRSQKVIKQININQDSMMEPKMLLKKCRSDKNFFLSKKNSISTTTTQKFLSQDFNLKKQYQTNPYMRHKIDLKFKKRQKRGQCCNLFEIKTLQEQPLKQQYVTYKTLLRKQIKSQNKYQLILKQKYLEDVRKIQ